MNQPTRLFRSYWKNCKIYIFCKFNQSELEWIKTTLKIGILEDSQHPWVASLVLEQFLLNLNSVRYRYQSKKCFWDFLNFKIHEAEPVDPDLLAAGVETLFCCWPKRLKKWVALKEFFLATNMLLTLIVQLKCIQIHDV